MLLIVLSAALGACATLPQREDVSSAARMGGQLVDFTGTRFDTEAPIEIIRPWHDRWMAERRASGDDEPIDLLAISSGSDHHLPSRLPLTSKRYTANILCAWDTTPQTSCMLPRSMSK